MKTITLFTILLFSLCKKSIQENSNVLSESDRIIRVYDMNENLLTENIVGK